MENRHWNKYDHKQPLEEAYGGLKEKLFLKISRYSQENICVGVSFK